MTQNSLPNSKAPLAFADLSASTARSLDQICDCFEYHLQTQTGEPIEGLIAGYSEPERSILLRELLHLEIEAHRDQNTLLPEEKYLGRFPEHASLVHEVYQRISPSSNTEVVPNDPLPSIPKYRVLRKLNEGGMGTVYLAIHTELGNMVAVKFLRHDLVWDLEAEHKFQREQKIIGSLSHPNIVQARDGGKWEDSYYLVMEYVEGIDVAELVRRAGPLRLADACEIARRVALALQYAYEKKLVHRDIKPKNILFGRSYRASPTEPAQVKVADFGLALLRGYPRPSDVGQPIEIVGTYPFMAPEQYWECRSDIRSDIYGLGCTLYHMLLRSPPYLRDGDQNTEELMEAHRSAEIPPLRQFRPDISEELESIIGAMLAKSPAQRPQTPAIVAEQLAPHAASHDLDRLLREVHSSVGSTSRLPTPTEPFHPIVPPSVDEPKNASISSPRADSPPEPPSAARGVAGTDEQVAVKPPEGRGKYLSGAETVQYSPSPSRDGAAKDAPILPSNSSAAVVSTSSTVAGPSRPSAPTSRRVLVLVGVTILIAAVSIVVRNAMRSPQVEPVDILSEIDPQRDSISGTWQREGKYLVSPDVPNAAIALRSSPPAAYRLEIRRQRLSGGVLAIGLVRGNDLVPVLLNELRVKSESRNEQADAAAKQLASDVGFNGGPRYTYTCIVHPKGLLVAYENEVQFALAANAAPSVNDPGWKLPNGTGLFLGTENSVFRFERITMIPLQP